MSKYYFMVCDKHMERTDAASKTNGGIGGLGDSQHTLRPFIIVHCDCPVRIVSEHHEDAFDERFSNWTEENLGDMLMKDRA